MEIVVIGSGIAGDSTAMAIRKVAADSKTTPIKEKTTPLYSPCSLNHHLWGKMCRGKVFLKRKQDYLKKSLWFTDIR